MLLHTHQDVYHQKQKQQQKITSVGEDWRNWNPHTLLLWTLNDTATVENRLAVPQLVNDRITIWITKWRRNSTPKYIPERSENRFSDRSLHMNVPSSTLHIAKRWKSCKCLSTTERINKMWYIHTMEYYWATTRNEALIHAITMDKPQKRYAKWKKPDTKESYI